MKILLLPLFRMPSGHHKAAEAIIDHSRTIANNVEVQTVDLLSHFHSGLESIISGIYLKWISKQPASYSRFYHSFMYTNKQNSASWSPIVLWNKYFEWRMNHFIKEENPDLIICTHCYPSKLLNNLKRQGKVTTPVINVYTDFFINDVWGKEYIDYHFVPHQEAKKQLVEQFQLKTEQIFVTGIPVHPSFYERKESCQKQYILIAGGNSGLGNVQTLLSQLMTERNQYYYKVLCGNNHKLHEWISSLNHDHIEPIGYTSCRQQMNRYYNEAAAIITKPGGITITEVLEKSLPTFILSALPGQEEINIQYLKDKRLIYELNVYQAIEPQLSYILNNKVEYSKWKKRLIQYHQEKEDSINNCLINIIEKNIDSFIHSYKTSAPM
ncbi:glycosyltransferase [Bacillus sp. REN10]|uniref:MGDG synthase family glycosyltransferase n=1 Tax=Bacillus sp. REN10 TaxID=2782541 RepID=UPI00193BD2DE|nr:glycosyltransferase [Bacillus sp. REN10]